MIFHGLKEENGWTIAQYSATWGYGYDFMLDAAQTIIDSDFSDKTQRVAVAEAPGSPFTEYIDDVRAADYNLRACPSVCKEGSGLIIAGESKLMHVPVQFAFFNQTNIIRICCPFKNYFEANGEQVFTNYINSIEIKAHCRATERQTIKKFTEQEDK